MNADKKRSEVEIMSDFLISEAELVANTVIFDVDSGDKRPD